MPGLAFNPLVQTAQATLSCVLIRDVSCPEVNGSRAEDVCSRDALLALATEYGLTGLRPHRLADDIRTAACSDDASTRQAANTTVAEFGRRLGALIATLRDPATAGEQGDTAVRQAYLLHWLTVDRIWLAGGLLVAGPAIAAAAAKRASAAARPCPVALAPHPAITPLLGAARMACTDDLHQAIAVADLGQTSLKTAVVKRSATAVTELGLMDAVAAPAGGSPDVVENAVAAALIGVARRAAGEAASSKVRVLVSVAAYVAGGAPVDDGEGIYGCLAYRVESLTQRVAVGSDADVAITFLHDSTAAATAGTANSATLTTGTWPGAGFRPAQAAPLLELAPDFCVRYA